MEKPVKDSQNLEKDILKNLSRCRTHIVTSELTEQEEVLRSTYTGTEFRRPMVV